MQQRTGVASKKSLETQNARQRVRFSFLCARGAPIVSITKSRSRNILSLDRADGAAEATLALAISRPHAMPNTHKTQKREWDCVPGTGARAMSHGIYMTSLSSPERYRAERRHSLAATAWPHDAHQDRGTRPSPARGSGTHGEQQQLTCSD